MAKSSETDRTHGVMRIDLGPKIREMVVSDDETKVTIPADEVVRMLGGDQSDEALKVDGQQVRMKATVLTPVASAVRANRMAELLADAEWTTADLAAAAYLPAALIDEYLAADDAETIDPHHQKQIAAALSLPVDLVFPSGSNGDGAVKVDRYLGEATIGIPPREERNNRELLNDWEREAQARRQADLERDVGELRRDVEIAGVRHSARQIQRKVERREAEEQQAMDRIRHEMGRRH